MEQHNSKTRDNTDAPRQADPTEPDEGPAEVLPPQQQNLPEGGDFSSPEPVGGSKPDPVSTGPNVEDTIAGRN
ncbi:MAG TPA: hypothetical protein VF221_19105 [Chloroflexota bacterium]